MPFTMRFREGIQVEGTAVATPERRWRLPEAWRPLLDLLQGPGATEDHLASLVLQREGPAALAGFQYALLRLSEGGALVHRLPGLAERVPMGPVPDLRVYAPDQRAGLSRFCLLRREGGRMVLETPKCPARLVLEDWRGPAMLGALAPGASAADLAAIPGVTLEGAAAFLSLLQGCGALGNDGDVPESWEFHDLLFHSRSRLGRHDRPYGGTWRFEGEGPPPLKPPMGGEFLPLAEADLDRLAVDDLPLERAMAERRSLREHGDPPLGLDDLGRFLHRTARVVGMAEGERGSVARRPYPGGGARHELEVYLVVHRCQGLEPGLFHYDPARHGLEHLEAADGDREALLERARGAAGMDGPPQVLLILAARFGRVAWKYESMAYATILKDVGVLYQTMYLVAASMGLAACAVGGGDADRFARAAGTDYYQEGSVGEFLLGSIPRS